MNQLDEETGLLDWIESNLANNKESFMTNGLAEVCILVSVE